MKKRFDMFTFFVVVLCVIVIFVFAVMMANSLRAAAADLEAREIMEQAHERIDIYEAANTPATERPTATVVVYEESPVVETPEPSPEPVEDWYIESIPLDKRLQKVVFDAACENGVDYLLALAVMSVESDFDSTAVSVCGCYGLMQLNPLYFPSGLSDEDNIRSGVLFLGELLEQNNGDVPAALRAYNNGYDDGDRVYANAVLSAAEDIMQQAGVVFP